MLTSPHNQPRELRGNLITRVLKTTKGAKSRMAELTRSRLGERVKWCGRGRSHAPSARKTTDGEATL